MKRNGSSRIVTARLLSTIMLISFMYCSCAGLAIEGQSQSEYENGASSRPSWLSAETQSSDDYWRVFTDPNLGLSIKYPEDWYLTEDPTFQNPDPVPGALERRAVFSSFANPIFGGSEPANGCRLDLLFSDSGLDSIHPIAYYGNDNPPTGQFTTTLNGLTVYELDHDFEEVYRYGYYEWYVPYIQGTMVLVSWAATPQVESTCSSIAYSMLDSLELAQSNHETNFSRVATDFSLDTGTMPRELEPPFSGQIVIQQGWKYNFYYLDANENPTNKHEGIDYVAGEVAQSNTWQSFDVLAAADGQATYLGYFENSWGHTVIVKHNFDGEVFYTLYAHLSSWEVPGSNEWQNVQANVVPYGRYL